MIPTVLNWSSGKDAALSYYLLQQEGKYDVRTLLTTINTEKNRVVMHGLREELLGAQAERMGLPLRKVYLPASPDHEVYNNTMTRELDALKQQGITTSAFGDIHLEDLKAYREQQLQQAGFTGLFPLWGRDVREMVQMIEEVGIEPVIVCVNANKLGQEFLGRKVNKALLAELPEGVDPCGEYGEFHTFVFNAPYFSAPIAYRTGEVVHRQYAPTGTTVDDKGFYFLDVYPD